MFELSNKGYKLLVAHCSRAHAGMLPQLAMLVARRSFFNFSFDGLAGNKEPLAWTRPPEPRLFASKRTGGVGDAHAEHRPALRSLKLGAPTANIIATASSVNTVTLHSVSGGVYTHKVPLRPGDNVTVGDVGTLVKIDTLFTWNYDIFFAGARGQTRRSRRMARSDTTLRGPLQRSPLPGAPPQFWGKHGRIPAPPRRLGFSLLHRTSSATSGGMCARARAAAGGGGRRKLQRGKKVWRG